MCEFCRSEREISLGDGHSFFIVRVAKGYKLDYLDDINGVKFGVLIAYCPICGRKLTDGEENEVKTDKYIEELLDEAKKLNDRHQSDFITINKLNVTIDVLVNKLARLREVHGL